MDRPQGGPVASDPVNLPRSKGFEITPNESPGRVTGGFRADYFGA